MEILKPIEREKIIHLKQMLYDAQKKFSDNIAFFERDNTKDFQIRSFTELLNDVNAVGAGIFSSFDLKNKKVAIASENSYKWMVTYLAVVLGNGIVVPIDNKLPENELENNLKLAKPDLVVYSKSKKEWVNNIRVRNDLDYSLLPFEEEIDNPLSYETIKEKGKELISSHQTDYLETSINADKFSMLVSTSATSADSKAVKLSHKNLASNMNHINKRLGLQEDDVTLNVLPNHHIYGTIMQLMMLNAGGASAISSLLTFQRDMQTIQPTVINFVPAILMSFQKRIIKELKKNGHWDLYEKYLDDENLSEEENKIIELIKKEILKIFGGKLRLIICAAAPLDEKVAHFFIKLGIDVVEAYGLTEGTAVVSLSDRRLNIAGYVGHIDDESDVKIELANQDEYGNGEIITSSDSVMLGYENNPEATEEALELREDGRIWLHTGDLGKIDLVETNLYGTLRMLKITGRIKNVIVTRGGKNIYPEEIEHILSQSDLIAEVMVAELNDKLTAVIVLDKNLMRELEIDDETARRMIDEFVNSTNNNLPDYKKISRVVINEDSFPKTTTNKIQRGKVKLLEPKQ